MIFYIIDNEKQLSFTNVNDIFPVTLHCFFLSNQHFKVTSVTKQFTMILFPKKSFSLIFKDKLFNKKKQHKQPKYYTG